MALPSLKIDEHRCLAVLRMLDGTARYIQNWQPDPLLWRGKYYNYFEFPLPPITKKLGSDVQSIELTLPNISAHDNGYLPIRDLVESERIAGAFISIYIFNSAGLVDEHVFTVQEQEFDEGTSESVIRLTLRPPDSRQLNVNTRVFSDRELGEVVRVG
jgi:hypothetical protein